MYVTICGRRPGAGRIATKAGNAFNRSVSADDLLHGMAISIMEKLDFMVLNVSNIAPPAAVTTSNIVLLQHSKNGRDGLQASDCLHVSGPCLGA